jgi:hypothetical protein
VSPIKAQHGVPESARACHTAVVEGYVVEGHVPADAIRRLLKDRLNVVGIAVPGMVTGTPGMEGPKQPYQVVAFDKAGKTTVYERH